jgi:predicted nucleic-acid-binding Zn-ribbon protein
MYVSVYALKQECIKCGKERIKEVEEERTETTGEFVERVK